MPKTMRLVEAAVLLLICGCTLEGPSSDPIADAGLDRSARVGNYALLDGSGSKANNGGVLTYQWTADAGNPAHPWFLDHDSQTVIPLMEVGVYRFTLVVHNGENYSTPAQVKIEVGPRMSEVFEDPVLEVQVRYQLRRPTEELTDPVLRDLDSLIVFRWLGITSSLRGITSCPNLRFLGAPLHAFVELSPLASLDKLEFLEVDQNRAIDNIEPLKGLTNLKHLNLLGTNVTDIGSLTGMTKMVELNISETKVHDIAPLSDMVDLEVLWMGYSELIDIGVLSKFSKLTLLWLPWSGLDDISALRALGKLRVLHLGSNNVSNILPIGDCREIERLYIDRNKIADIAVLEFLSKLTLLNLDRNLVKDISPLVRNQGLGPGCEILLTNNPLDSLSRNVHIPALLARGVRVYWTQGQVNGSNSPARK